MPKTLRPHQQDAHDATLAHWQAGHKRALVSACVASGKSLMQAAIAKTVCERWPRSRVLCLTMTQELIEQNHEELVDFFPTASVGINSAGLKRRDTDNQIIFAHPLSIFRKVGQLGPRHVLMIDEVHNVSRKQEPSTDKKKKQSVYGQIITGLLKMAPNMVILGLTGTPYRLDSGRLDEGWKGEPAFWDKIVYEYGILDGIRDGYLVPATSKRTGTQLDVSAVGTRGGEFIDAQLQAAVDKDDLNGQIAGEIIGATQDRKSCLVFASGIKHAEHLRDKFAAAGHSTALVTSEMDRGERERVIAAIKNGEIRYPVNVGILTTGFNWPPLDACALVRPTKSSGLLVQMIGRTLRASEGKADSLVLDFAGNLERCGTIDTIDGGKTPGKGGSLPVKVCPDCSEILHASVMKCTGEKYDGTVCGHEFPPPRSKLKDRFADAPVLSIDEGAEWYNVDAVVYSVHQKTDRMSGEPIGPASFRISYRVGWGMQVSEYLSFESPKAGGRQFARNKWSSRYPGEFVPENAEQAMMAAGALRKPGRIRARKDGKFYELLATDFTVLCPA